MFGFPATALCCIRDCWMLSRMPALLLKPSMRSRNFGSAGIIGNSRAQPDFWQQNRRLPKHKTWVWSADLGFSPHFRNRPSEVCGKFWNPRAHRHFCAKKPQVVALAQLGVVGLFRFCRILLESVPRGLSRGVHNPKDLLKTALKILDTCVGSVQYACLA